MNVLNLSFLNEWSHRAFQHFINWISGAETLAQVFTFPQCSLYNSALAKKEDYSKFCGKQMNAEEAHLKWNWKSFCALSQKIREVKKYRLLKPTFAVTKMPFFLLSILLKLENRNDANTNFCDVSGDNMLLALLTTQLTNSGYFLLAYTHLTTFLKRKFFWERVFVEY